MRSVAMWIVLFGGSMALADNPVVVREEVVAPHAIRRKPGGLYSLGDGEIVFTPTAGGAEERTPAPFRRAPGFRYYLDDQGSVARIVTTLAIEGDTHYYASPGGRVQSLQSNMGHEGVEMVARLAIRRDPAYLYFVSGTSVLRVRRDRVFELPARFERVAAPRFVRDDRFLYYIDQKGDLVRGL